MSGKSGRGVKTFFAAVLLISVISMAAVNFGLHKASSFAVTPETVSRAEVETGTAAGSGSTASIPDLSQAKSLRIQLNGEKLKLRGTVASEQEQKLILGMITANLPGRVVQDKTKIAPGTAADGAWLSAVSYLLRQMALMRTGNASLRGQMISLSGVASSAEAYKTLQDAILDVPKGFQLSEDDRITPPAEAYVWLANYKDGALKLSGLVPNETAQERMIGYAEALFPDLKLDNETKIADGAPNNWAEAVYVSLRALKFLRNGSAALSDQTIRVEGLAEATEIVQHIEALNETLPEGFSLESDLMTPQQTQIPSAADFPADQARMLR